MREINFADTGEHYDTNLLIGSDCYWNLFTGKKIKSQKSNTIIANESKFGWVLYGAVEKQLWKKRTLLLPEAASTTVM